MANPTMSIDVRHDTPVYFAHPAIPKTLVIKTGANQIQWSYQLNTSVTPSYGGEVVQILSCFVDAMTITGSSTDNAQLKAIYDWFLIYMQKAGLHNRNESAVHFRYPERGWSFWIQPTALPGYKQGLDKIATEWQLRAEVVSDNDLNVLASHTMSQYTDVLTDKSMFDIGFRDRDPRNDPSANWYITNGYTQTGFAKNLGDNFQHLLGSWASGDFAHWAFDVLANPEQNKFKNADTRDYWIKLFGSDFVDGKRSNQSGGQFAYGGPVNPSQRSDVVGAINAAFEGANMPGKLGVATAIVESGLDPDNRTPNDGGPGIDGIGLFMVHWGGAVNQGSGSEYHRAEVYSASKVHAGEGKNVTTFYPSGDQISDATHWFKGHGSGTSDAALADWAYSAQRPANQSAYKNAILRALGEAERLIQTSSAAAPHGGPNGWTGLARGNLTFVGPDQGLDFTGTGSLIAVASGRIVKVDTSSGWPGGTLIVLKLERSVHRPVIGITATHVYYAEALTPHVNVGQHVNKGDLIATLSSSYPGSETGWARDDAGSAYGSIHDGKSGGPSPIYGNDFGTFVQSL